LSGLRQIKGNILCGKQDDCRIKSEIIYLNNHNRKEKPIDDKNVQSIMEQNKHNTLPGQNPGTTHTDKIRTRFAPSPTGLLHVGSFRTAFFNWLFARKSGGSFILRIEDTDRKRSEERYLKSQLADINWMGIEWDEGPEIGGEHGPYFQMQRLDIYKKHVGILLSRGLAYQCYCTPEELKEDREKARKEKETDAFGYPGKCRNLAPEQISKYEEEGRKPCIRFKSPAAGETRIVDRIKGEVDFDNKLLDDFVIVKSDGIPTYNFAVVVDDHLMGITHIIRGDEHFSNTPKQVLLYEAFGFIPPQFVHIPIILNEDRTKLSKRKGAVHLLEYRDRGYLREALLNFLALLGWAPKDNREILSMEELKEAFSLEGITKHPAIFDEKKLEWMNGQYLTSLPPEKIIKRLKPFLLKRGINPEIKDDEWYREAILLYRERMKTLDDLAENLAYYFIDFDNYDPRGIKKHFKHAYIEEALPFLAGRIEQAGDLTVENLENIVRTYADELGLSAGKLIHPIRLAITGKTGTPPIFDVMKLMGKEKLKRRLNQSANFIHSGLKSEDEASK